MYQSNSDQIVPASSVDHLYDMWCSLGANVEYHADIASGHISEVIYGAPEHHHSCDVGLLIHNRCWVS